MATNDAAVIRAPQGTHLHCKGWVQEAALAHAQEIGLHVPMAR